MMVPRGINKQGNRFPDLSFEKVAAMSQTKCFDYFNVSQLPLGKVYEPDDHYNESQLQETY